MQAKHASAVLDAVNSQNCDGKDEALPELSSCESRSSWQGFWNWQRTKGSRKQQAAFQSETRGCCIRCGVELRA